MTRRAADTQCVVSHMSQTTTAILAASQSSRGTVTGSLTPERDRRSEVLGVVIGCRLYRQHPRDRRVSSPVDHWNSTLYAAARALPCAPGAVRALQLADGHRPVARLLRSPREHRHEPRIRARDDLRVRDEGQGGDDGDRTQSEARTLERVRSKGSPIASSSVTIPRTSSRWRGGKSLARRSTMRPSAKGERRGTITPLGCAEVGATTPARVPAHGAHERDRRR